MKRALTLLVVMAVGSTAMAAPSLDLTVRETTSGSSDIRSTPVLPGTVIEFEIHGVLSSSSDNEGLALFGLDLTHSGGALDGATVVNPTADATMQNFTRLLGITNPDSPCPPACGFSGTIINDDLIQVGGGQNTINNTSGNAPFPVGGVIVNVAHPPNGQVLVTGSIVAPSADGDYTLSIPVSSVFANVISPGQGCAPDPNDPSTFCSAEAATVGAVIELQYAVLDDICTPSVMKWESVGFHGRDFNADWAMEITPKNSSSNLPTFVEPRLSGLSRIRVTFTHDVAAATAIPGNIQVTGVDENGAAVDTSASIIGVALSAGTGTTDIMEISFTPALPNFANYTVSFAGVTAECGGGAAYSGDVSRCMSALIGDVNGNLRVQTNDVGGARSFVGTDPIDPVTQPFHARADVNNDGRIRTNDVGGVRAFVGNDIRGGLCPAP